MFVTERTHEETITAAAASPATITAAATSKHGGFSIMKGAQYRVDGSSQLHLGLGGTLTRGLSLAKSLRTVVQDERGVRTDDVSMAGHQLV